MNFLKENGSISGPQNALEVIHMCYESHVNNLVYFGKLLFSL
jgi:hypothetical protein